jgi:hypothetical protein
MNTRPYLVTDTETKSKRIIVASSRAQAIQHIASARYSAAPATVSQVIDFAGVAVETAGRYEAGEDEGSAA